MHKNLFIPGPTEVSDDVLHASATKMIGHRSKDYEKLQKECIDGLNWIFSVPTDYRVFVSTSSATGVMEACVRNLVHTNSFHTVCGAFSKKWAKIAEQNGKIPKVYEVENGKGIHPEKAEAYLNQKKYDACFFTHMETSMGVLNPLEKFNKMMDNHGDTLFCVDAVSSAGGMEINLSELDNIDVLLFGLQKCFAGPPGVAFAIVSPRAMERATKVKNKGHYFNFLEWDKKAKKNQTIVTPPISQLFAFNKQIERMKKESLKYRYERHTQMAETVRNWAIENFELFPEEGFYGDTVSCIKNTRKLSVSKLNEELAKRGKMISNGYGDLKEKTFRIGHMGDHTNSEILELLLDIDEIWGLR